MKKMKVEKRGGKRNGAGRKNLYSESTTTIAFRVPESKIEEIKNHVKTKLSNYKTNQK
jgi:hypothetical protein